MTGPILETRAYNWLSFLLDQKTILYWTNENINKEAKNGRVLSITQLCSVTMCALNIISDRKLMQDSVPTISYLQAFLVSVVDDNPDFPQRSWWVGLREPVNCPQHGLCHYVMGVSQVSSPQGWQSHSSIATLTGQIQTLGHNHLQRLSTTI